MRDHPACLSCGKPFPDTARVDRMYCDRRCNNRHYKQIQRGRVAPHPTVDYATVVSRMTPQQLGWVAGIIEGEGTISANSRAKYRDNHYTYPLITVAMTDEDVIRRLREWTGIGRVSGPHLPPVRAVAGYQPQWRWSVNKIAAVTAMMDILWPLLGERRRQHVTKVRQSLSERTLIRAGLRN